jgi:hypothetical protein
MIELPVPHKREEGTGPSSVAVVTSAVQAEQPQLKSMGASAGAGSAVALTLGIVGLFLSGPVGALVGAAVGGAIGKLVVGAISSLEEKVQEQRGGEDTNARS